MEIFELSKVRVIKLSRRNIKLVKDFNCEDKDLNDFLKEDAIGHTKDKITMTYLFLYNSTLLGFFCLGAFAIRPPEEALKILKERGKNYSLFPAILIARIGVDKRYQRRGVGTEIISVILGFAENISKRIGCRFVVVHAYHNAVDFYKKNGFKVLTSRDKKTVEMYFDLLHEF